MVEGMRGKDRKIFTRYCWFGVEGARNRLNLEIPIDLKIGVGILDIF